MLRSFLVLITLIGFQNTSCGGIVFMEDFGSLSDGTLITSGNTSLTYAREGSGNGGALVAKSPSSFSGSSLVLGGGTSTSITGIGWTTGFGDPGLARITLNLGTQANSTDGDLFVGAGSGSTFTGNSTFSTSNLTFAIQSNNGILQYRSAGNWLNVGSALANDTNYSLELLANRSGSIANYTGGSIANGKFDLRLNGSLIGDDLDMQNAGQAMDGFRIYQVNGGASFELDDIVLANSLSSVPEPSSMMLLGVSMLGLALRRRRY